MIKTKQLLGKLNKNKNGPFLPYLQLEVCSLLNITVFVCLSRYRIVFGNTQNKAAILFTLTGSKPDWGEWDLLSRRADDFSERVFILPFFRLLYGHLLVQLQISSLVN